MEIPSRISLSELTDKLKTILERRFKDNCEPGVLSHQEAHSFCGVSKEEYEDSTKLFRLPNGAITGIGGWNLFQKASKEERLKLDKNGHSI
jgi:hypothetical protein